MLISLVVIRLEIADGCEVPVKFKPYCAKNFDRIASSSSSTETSSSSSSSSRPASATSSKPSYALVTKQSPSSSKENTSHAPSKQTWTTDRLTEHKGLRKNVDITLEYLSSQAIEAMEKEAHEMEAQQKKKLEEEAKAHKHERERESQQSPNSHHGEPPTETTTPTDPPVGGALREASAKNSEVGPLQPPARRRESWDTSSRDSDDPGPTPETPGKRRRSRSPSGRQQPSTVHFVSGNPKIELVKGILHLYKDSQMTPLDKDVPRSEMLCMMAIPTAYTMHDLLKFTAPLNASMVSMQVLRGAGAMHNKFMLLIKFKDQSSADEFYLYFNSRPFNSIEPDICHLVYVVNLEVMKESEGASRPIPGLTELPNCPVCLERMEESVDGVLTVLCNHSFHMSCLAQWDNTCPVCRYCQTPEVVPDQRCMQCGAQESLWICLICGCIGCGRYVALHAYKHFQETNHTYAMQLGSNRVWDYVGDNWVHRLAQNKSDGKLVELDEGGNAIQEEKLDSITLEYTYLLTTQLESQRRYFEEKIVEETKEANRRVDDLEDKVKTMEEEKSNLSRHLSEVSKEKHTLDRKYTQMHSKMGKTLADLQEERQLNNCLRENQGIWQEQVDSLEKSVKDLTISKDKEVGELREQLRDVMFYLEAQQKLSTASDISQEEIQDGQIIVGAAASSSSCSSPSDFSGGGVGGGKKRSKKRK